jgi:hypothetical protein
VDNSGHRDGGPRDRVRSGERKAASQPQRAALQAGISRSAKKGGEHYYSLQNQRLSPLFDPLRTSFSTVCVQSRKSYPCRTYDPSERGKRRRRKAEVVENLALRKF